MGSKKLSEEAYKRYKDVNDERNKRFNLELKAYPQMKWVSKLSYEDWVNWQNGDRSYDLVEYGGDNHGLIELIREKWFDLYAKAKRNEFSSLKEYAIRRRYYANIVTELSDEVPFDRLSNAGTIERSKIEQYGDLNDVMDEIYTKNHKSAFDDIEKHNEGIKKSMLEFAEFYHELLTTRG